jgi:hypothetical protein
MDYTGLGIANKNQKRRGCKIYIPKGLASERKPEMNMSEKTLTHAEHEEEC